jgi:hypothetical protein
MSQSECDRFTADLQSSATLRADVGKAMADKSLEPLLARMVAFAVSKGYSVTLAEAREHVKARAAATGQILSDADLDGVAAGADVVTQVKQLGIKTPGYDAQSSGVTQYF